MSIALTIQKNLLALQQQLREYEKKYQRESHSVALLAVSKNQSQEKIAAAITGGQKAFGESYLQEALPKMAHFSEQNLEWHYIGPIQSNKTKKIAENFFWVHSVDSMKVARRLNDQRPTSLPPLNICLEVNVSHELSKSGVDVKDIPELVDYCLSLPHLKLRGLMTIPAPKKTFTEQRAEFQKLHSLFENLRGQGLMLDTLSMGMSNDWEAAVAEGATIVRIGTAIFGAHI